MAENSIFSNWDNVVSDGRNDLVFENRHKDYGAFDIRRKYTNFVNRALIISCLSFVLLVSAPKIYSWIVEKAEAEKVVEIDMTQLDLDPPPIDETEPPPPPPPPPPVMETVKFTPPVVVDEEVIEEAPIITQEVEIQIATVTNEGTTDEIIIPEESGTGVVAENPETPFLAVEEMPEYPGGQEALFKYLHKNVNYPAMEKDAGISGTVYVTFVINKEGKVTNSEIKRGVKGGQGLEKEALRVIQSMPNWSIGKNNGRPAAVQFTLPVKFVLK